MDCEDIFDLKPATRSAEHTETATKPKDAKDAGQLEKHCSSLNTKTDMNVISDIEMEPSEMENLTAASRENTDTHDAPSSRVMQTEAIESSMKINDDDKMDTTESEAVNNLPTAVEKLEENQKNIVVSVDDEVDMTPESDATIQINTDEIDEAGECIRSETDKNKESNADCDAVNAFNTNISTNQEETEAKLDFEIVEDDEITKSTESKIDCDLITEINSNSSENQERDKIVDDDDTTKSTEKQETSLDSDIITGVETKSSDNQETEKDGAEIVDNNSKKPENQIEEETIVTSDIATEISECSNLKENDNKVKSTDAQQKLDTKFDIDDEMKDLTATEPKPENNKAKNNIDTDLNVQLEVSHKDALQEENENKANTVSGEDDPMDTEIVEIIDDEDDNDDNNKSTENQETKTDCDNVHLIKGNSSENQVDTDDTIKSLEIQATKIDSCIVTGIDSNSSEKLETKEDCETVENISKSPGNQVEKETIVDSDIITEISDYLKATDKKDDKSGTQLDNETTKLDIDSKIKDLATTDEPNTENIKDEDLKVHLEVEHKEDARQEKTEYKASTISEEDDPMDADYVVFYDKCCINCNCQKKHKQFLYASGFALNYYKVARKKYKPQYVCIDCYDGALEIYEEYAGLLVQKQPLLQQAKISKRADYVEIDSSDDEEENYNKIVMPHFSKNDLELIESELESTMKSVFEKIGVQNQLTWSKTLLNDRARKFEVELKNAELELRSVQEIADRMHNDLYNVSKIKVKELPPYEIGYTTGLQNELPQIPPAGEIQRPPIKLNSIYYAVKTKSIASWVPCRVTDMIEYQTVSNTPAVKQYKIRYLTSQYICKSVSAKNLAYYDAPSVRLTIGTRVIAYFDASILSRGKEKVMAQSAFYPGIIAEPLKQANKFRYLIFYDDGYTQYVQHKDVRLVCSASDKVWEDVHLAARDFIQKYVEQYSVNRPMVQTQKGQSMNTESNGTWLMARVIDIDCSLVLMQFDGPKNHTEWIYRGSLRLGPVFKESQKALQKNGAAQQSRLPRRTEPFVRYTEDVEASNTQISQQRALAKKSVSRQSSTVGPQQTPTQTGTVAPYIRHLNNSTIYVEDENRPKGQVIFYTAKRNLPPQDFSPHECQSSCLYSIATNLNAYSPLAKPLLSGWERMKYKQKIKRSIVYRSPCGVSLRNIEEVRQYLRATNNLLNVENFDFNPELHCLAEYVIDSAIVQRRDISNGQEKIAIPLVNYYDNTLPPPCTYAAQRIPTEGVFLNLDPEFLTCCDCTDDCSDKTKCACWQLTIQGVRYCNPNKPIEEIGYQYKRLLEHVSTGIYECNSRCKCKSNCLNRVVQHSLEMKLQVFKTSNRGWGLRCINDIPKGAFVCIYAGHLLTETKANEGGADAGDEYFADLDYIEVAEQLKEGYESDVPSDRETEDEDATYRPDAGDDDDFRPGSYQTKRKKLKDRVSRNSSQTSEEDSQERQVISFNPNADIDETVHENSVRRLFGKNEAPYIMDAKTTGNLGRYFNHSCNPNLYVQNVFVDTHDLRFPWVAFFAATYIRSGNELTWNYNYEVGVVPGKVLYCQCGSANCRIRLL